MKKIMCGVGACLAAAGLLTLPALGQSFERDRNTSVMDRPRPEYDALGRRVGAFTAYPAASFGVVHDDNIFGSASNEVSDTALSGAAELLLSSNWSRHMLSFFGLVSHNEYLDVSSESHTDFTLRATGRVDVQRATALGGSVYYQDLTELRTSSSVPLNAAEPIDYSLTGVEAYVSHERGRVLLGARSTWRSYDYSSVRSVTGGILDQSFRDRDIWTGTLRSDFALSPDTAFFIEGSYNNRNYDLAPPIVAFLRDSDGYEVLGGVNFDITNLIRGEIGAGYLRQSFDDPALPNVNGFGVRANVEWFPTQLTTVNFSAARSAEDSVFAGSSGYLSTRFSAGVDHELLRNLILSAELGYVIEDYKGIDREDERWSGTLAATYLMNRHVGVTGSYTYLEQNSSGTAIGRDYNANRVGISLRFHF